MSTVTSNIAKVSDVAGELTKVIKSNSVAYQVCGVQESDSRSPLVFGIKKGATGKSSFTIEQKAPSVVYDTGTTPSTDNFTEELIDDVFAIFGENAVDILKTIAGNSLSDALDNKVINYMYEISTKKTDVTYDFSTGVQSELIAELVLRINQERMIIAKTLKRGLPKMLIVSPAVAALLITNKMIAGNDSDYIAGSTDNVKFIGKMGDMMVFTIDQADLTAVSGDYVMIAHKSFIPGDASMILIPIAEPKPHLTRDKETGQPNLHFSQKYAYSENPLDFEAVATDLTDAVFTASDDSINSVIGGLDSLYDVGDNIEVSNANTAANDGKYVVESVTSNKIVVEGDVITDDTTNTATITKYNSDFIASFDLTLTGFTV